MFREFHGLHNERGTGLLEFALLLPMLLILLLGIIEIGRYAELSIVVASAARSAVQYGAQNLATAADNVGIQNAALYDGQSISGLAVVPAADAAIPSQYAVCGCEGTTLSNGQCSTTTPPACSSGSHWLVYVQVQTQGSFNSIFHYPGIPPSIVINSTAQMRVAQ